MIIPKARSDRGRQRSISLAGTSMFMLGLYAVMAAVPLPSFGSSNAMVRTLDPLFVERFSAPPPLDLARDEDRDEAPQKEPTEAAAADEEVGSALGELSRKFGPSALGPVAATSAATVGVPIDARRDAGLPSPVAGREEERFADLFGGAATLPPRARDRTEPSGTVRGALESVTRIRTSDSLASRVPIRAAEAEGRVEVSAGRAKRGPPASDVVIRAYEPARFNTVAVDRLADWLRAHAGELPVGVRVHLRQQPSNLTAVVPIVSGGRSLELYLMYNPSLRELHVVLVEGDRSVYLVDRGLQEQSRSLREGTVRRIDGEIVAVNSVAAAAGSDRAREFYSIFLSWWDVARSDAGR
ncbi:MAG: hypothetical protein OEW77_05240 [Gemmatimonadota bacterium]|nr:hypothetical protein [Gemmatimonadota bacterium]